MAKSISSQSFSTVLKNTKNLPLTALDNYDALIDKIKSLRLGEKVTFTLPDRRFKQSLHYFLYRKCPGACYSAHYKDLTVTVRRNVWRSRKHIGGRVDLISLAIDQLVAANELHWSNKCFVRENGVTRVVEVGKDAT